MHTLAEGAPIRRLVLVELIPVLSAAGLFLLRLVSLRSGPLILLFYPVLIIAAVPLLLGCLAGGLGWLTAGRVQVGLAVAATRFALVAAGYSLFLQAVSPHPTCGQACAPRWEQTIGVVAVGLAFLVSAASALVLFQTERRERRPEAT